MEHLMPLSNEGRERLARIAARHVAAIDAAEVHDFQACERAWTEAGREVAALLAVGGMADEAIKDAARLLFVPIDEAEDRWLAR